MVAAAVRLVAQGEGGGVLYIAETDETAPSGLKLCRLYYADRDHLVPDWRLPLGSLVAHSDPWDVEAVSLPDAERARIEARVTALIAAEREVS